MKKPQELNSRAVYLRDTICVIVHTYKLLHPSKQMTWLEWQVHHKDRRKIISVSLPESLLSDRGKVTPCSEAKSEFCGKGAAGPHTAPASHPLDAS